MAISAKHKKNMKEVASWLRDNPDVDIDYKIFSNVSSEDASSLDNHTIGDPIGWAAAILGRPEGMEYIEFSQEELGIELDSDEFNLIAEQMFEDFFFDEFPIGMTGAEFVAMQFDWVSDGKTVVAFVEEWLNN